MASYPEHGTKKLPEISLTATQQKWKKAQTDALTARYAWKSAQMAFMAEADGHKAYLTIQFGENYLKGMRSEFRDVTFGGYEASEVGTALDLGSKKFRDAVAVLRGPEGAPKPSAPIPPGDEATETETADFIVAQAAYTAEMEEWTLPFGARPPNDVVAARLLTLLIKMGHYERVYGEQARAGAKYSFTSIMKGEFPPPGMLRTASRSGFPDPIKFGAANDNPQSWIRGRKKFEMELAQYAENNGIVPDTVEAPVEVAGYITNKVKRFLRTSYNRVLLFRLSAISGKPENGYTLSWKRLPGFIGTAPQPKVKITYQQGRDALKAALREIQPAPGPIRYTQIRKENWSYLDGMYEICKAFNLVYDKFGGLGIPTKPQPVDEATLKTGGSLSNDVIFIQPIMFMAAKAYGKTNDPLNYWGTLSRYRLRGYAARRAASDTTGTRFGDNISVVDLVRVDPRTGAPTTQYVTIAKFTGKSPGEAIAEVKRYLPGIMDLESGNNPRLDTTLNKTEGDRQLSEAAQNFSSIPQSERDNYRYIVVAETNMNWPESVINDPLFMEAYTNRTLKRPTDPKLAWKYDFQIAFNPNLRVNEQFDGAYRQWLTKLPMAGVPDRWSPHYSKSPRHWLRAYSEDTRTPFSWVRYFKHLSPTTKVHTTTLPANKPVDPAMIQLLTGYPTAHPDSRMTSSVSIYLVPVAFEAAFRQVLNQGQNELNTTVREDIETKELPKVKPASVYDTDDGHIYLRDREWMGAVRRQTLMMQLINSGLWLRFPNENWNLPEKMKVSDNDHFTKWKGNYYDSKERGPRSKHHDNFAWSHTGIPTDANKADLEDARSRLNSLGLDFQQIREVLRVPVNDVADFVKVLTGFKKSFPGISEMMTFDFKPEQMATTTVGGLLDNDPTSWAKPKPYSHQLTFAHPFQMSLMVGMFSSLDPIISQRTQGMATHMLRRVPYDTIGTNTNKRYNMGSISNLESMFQLTASTPIKDPLRAQLSSEIAPIATGVGALIAGMMLVKHLPGWLGKP